MNHLLKRIVAIIMLLTGAISPRYVLADDAASFTMRFMTPETALKAAQAALRNCRDAGFQASVAVVDRTGQMQVVLRDRFAGMHTPTAAVNKAWTAASFKISTSQLAEVTQGGKASSGIRDIARVLAVGGGIMIEVAGDIYGAIGVSGAPNGEADERCAKAGLGTIVEDLEL